MGKNTFYVVVKHDSGIFSSLYYRTDKDILTESDLLEIEKVHADRSEGFLKITTTIISWQRIETGK